MKRIQVGLLLLMFFAAGLQVPLHAHYCGGILQDWQLYEKVISCCEHEKHNEPHYTFPCCKEKEASYTLSDYNFSKKSTLHKNIQLSDYQIVRSSPLKKHYIPKQRRALPGPAPPAVPFFLRHAALRL